jgi:hypothetical protein
LHNAGEFDGVDPESRSRHDCRQMTKKTTLSFGLIVINAAPYVEKLLVAARSFADELIVGVDSSSSDATEEICRSYADKVFRIAPVGGDLYHVLGWLHEQCTGDWILRLDADELPSSGLVTALPDLIADREVTHYLLPRRWVIGLDTTRWITEHPWWPDYQIRLYRNIRSLIEFPRTVHQPCRVVGEGRTIAEGSIYHYDLVYHSEARRRAKVQPYEKLAPGRSLPWFYLTDTSILNHNSLPAHDLPFALVSSGRNHRAPAAVVDISDADRRDIVCQQSSFGPELFRADISVLQEVLAIRSGELQAVEVQLSNLSNAAWGSAEPGVADVRLSYHWLTRSGEVYERDGLRTLMACVIPPEAKARVIAQVRAPAEPGIYTLQWDLVIENVAWFSDHGFNGPLHEVRIQPPLPPFSDSVADVADRVFQVKGMPGVINEPELQFLYEQPARTLEELAASLTPCYDFGCGSSIWKGFVGIDLLPEKKVDVNFRSRYLHIDYLENTHALRELPIGKFVTARHTLCAIPRGKVLKALQNIYSVVAKDGYFMVSDLDLNLLLKAVSQNDPKLLGSQFSGWYNWLLRENKIRDTTWETLLNVGMRGLNETEVMWRYSQKTLRNLLEEAGFKDIEYIAYEDKRASAFTHFRPKEDMVFFCRK